MTPLISYSQKSIEFTVGTGYTLSDIEKLVTLDEVSGTIALDWSLLSAGVSGQYFFTSFGKVGFGAELMYQYLYWYSVRVPYGSQTIYREYSVSAIKVAPILRIGAENSFSFDFGPEFNFSNGLIFGVLMSANYSIPVSDKINIPLKLRMDIMHGHVVAVPISFNAGKRIKL